MYLEYSFYYLHHYFSIIVQKMFPDQVGLFHLYYLQLLGLLSCKLLKSLFFNENIVLIVNTITHVLKINEIFLKIEIAFGNKFDKKLFYS